MYNIDFSKPDLSRRHLSRQNLKGIELQHDSKYHLGSSHIQQQQIQLKGGTMPVDLCQASLDFRFLVSRSPAHLCPHLPCAISIAFGLSRPYKPFQDSEIKHTFLQSIVEIWRNEKRVCNFIFQCRYACKRGLQSLESKRMMAEHRRITRRIRRDIHTSALLDSARLRCWQFQREGRPLTVWTDCFMNRS